MGNISEFAVKRWQFTLVVFSMLTALGVSSFFSIPKSEDPTFPLPVFFVVAVLPGASPADLEQLVIDPIEERFQTLDRVERIEATILDSVAAVIIEFETGVDVPRQEDALRRELDGLRPNLPSQLARLDLNTVNSANVNILELGLVSETASYAELDRVARRFESRFEAVPGVGEAAVEGVVPQEVRIALDLPRMRVIGVTPGEVIAAVTAETTSIPAGSVETSERRFTVQTGGDYESIEEIRNTVIRAGAGRAIRLREIAEVTFGDGEAIHLVRVNGQRGVLVVVNQREGQNIFAVRKGLEEAIDELEPTLPRGISLVRTFDQSQNVDHRLAGFVRDFILAILLVLLTLLPLGVRASVIVMVSIPLSIAIGLTMLFYAGHGINQLSIVGFVIALGLLVDDSVVVVENIARFIRLGHSPLDAAIGATKQITLSVLGCTATLIFAFVPLLALPGNAGAFIRCLPLAVVFTVGASLFVSLTVVPFLASLILKDEGEHGNAVFRVMTRVIEGSYRPILAIALRNPIATVIAASVLFVGSLTLVPLIGFSVFPKAGVPQFLIRIETAESASLSETDRAVRFVEGVLRGHSEVIWQVANVGKGNPMVYYNLPQSNEQPNLGEVYASLDHFDTESSPILLDTIRRELSTYPGARIRLIEFENGPPVDAPIAIRLLGNDIDSLAEAAAAVESVFRATPGTRDVGNPSRERRTDLRIALDSDRAAALGVAGPDVDRAMRLALGGIPAGRFREANDDVARDIRVVLARSGTGDIESGAARPDLSILNDIFAPTSGGGAVPLSAIAELVLQPSPTTIRHYGGMRSSTVTAFVETGFNTERVTNEILERLEEQSIPPGVRMVVAGEVESRQKSFGGIGTAIIIAGFGIFAVLVLEFRTFKGTLIVASVIPLGVVGGLCALLLTGNTLSFTAMVGFVALMGIEVKNSILLVDFTNQLREEGIELEDAILQAGETRFVPILLTTLTAIGGLMPLALEHSPLYSPLAWVILGGLVSSTLLARIVTPVMYKLLPPPVDAPPSLAPLEGESTMLAPRPSEILAE